MARTRLVTATMILVLADALGGQTAKAPCDRACLEGFINQYLDAMVAHNPFGLPLAHKIRFSENEQLLRFGEGLWVTATAPGTYKLYVADPQAGQVAFLGTMRENGTPIALALRLKVENRRISEAETLVIRDQASAKAIEAMGQPDPVFLETVPASQRKPRDEMVAITNKYFDGIEQSKGGIVPFDPGCNRVQNGIRTTNNPDLKIDPAASWNPFVLGCAAQLDTRFFSFVRRIYPRRFLVIDEERGLVFGSFLFQIPGTVKSVEVPGHGTMPMDASNLTPYTLDVAELYKIASGRIRRVEALQTKLPYGTPSPFFGDK